MIALLYLLNVAGSAGQSTCSKYFASRGGSVNLYNINKAGVALLVFLIVGLFRGISFHVPTILLGFGYGAFIYVGSFAGFTALGLGPMALTSMIASFSLVIPFAVGVTVWGETLSVWGILGIILLVCSIVLLNFKKIDDRLSLKWTFFTFLTFFVTGGASVFQKQHQMNYPGLYRTEFMIASMLCMLVLQLIVVLVKGTVRTEIRFCVPGSLGGFLEGAATYIVLYLAASQNASVLFPVVSVAKIIAVWCIGRMAFKEQLKLWQTVGLVAGIAAIALLNLK